METLILVFEEPDMTLCDIAEGLAGADVSIGGGDERVVVVTRGASRVYVVQVRDGAEEVFDDWPTDVIPRGTASVFSLDFRDGALVVDIVHILARRRRCLVDTNYGHVISGIDLRPTHIAS